MSSKLYYKTYLFNFECKRRSFKKFLASTLVFYLFDISLIILIISSHLVIYSSLSLLNFFLYLFYFSFFYRYTLSYLSICSTSSKSVSRRNSVLLFFFWSGAEISTLKSWFSLVSSLKSFTVISDLEYSVFSLKLVDLILSYFSYIISKN